MSVQALADAAELVSLLPLAHVSVVLFTAAWSYDSGAAQAALENVASTFPSRGVAPYVAFYSVPLPIAAVHASPPRRGAGGAAPAVARAAYNATRHIPWFPALRVFASTNTGGSATGLPPFTYGDSFTAPAIRRFVLDVAHRVIEDLERREEQVAEDGTRASMGAHEGARERCPLASAADGARWRPWRAPECRSERGMPPPLSAATAARTRTALTALLPRVGDPVEMSPDGLTDELFRVAPAGGARLGALLLAPGGADVVAARHRVAWRALAAAAEAEALAGRRPWVVSVIDSAEFREFADRLGVAPTAALPAFVLLDSSGDSATRAPALPETVAAAAAVLREFTDADAPVRSLPPPLRDATPRTPHAHEMARDENVVSVIGEDLDRVASSLVAQGRGVWVVVHQRWCGFSQRAMAVFRDFAAAAPGNVTVVEVTEIDGLPSAADVLVDGFPTVLIVDSGASGRTDGCPDGRCRYAEHVGELSVASLIESKYGV